MTSVQKSCITINEAAAAWQERKSRSQSLDDQVNWT